MTKARNVSLGQQNAHVVACATPLSERMQSNLNESLN
jgi:hypothetical protein